MNEIILPHRFDVVDATVSELKQKLEQAMKAWQDEKEQLMNQIKELLDRYSGRTLISMYPEFYNTNMA